jgi:hypothetical protein
VFVASAPFLFFDYFRVPYRVAAAEGDLPSPPLPGWNRLCWGGSGPSLFWPTELVTAASPRLRWVGGTPFFARLADVDLSSTGWKPETSIVAEAGAAVASTWRDDDGNVLIPFDPGEAIRNLWSEAYLRPARGSVGGRAKRSAMWLYYRVRPAVPRRAQIALRRAFAQVQARTRFPSWPLETALLDLYSLLFRWIADLAPEPVPWIAPWPAGRSWALVLTHDVETAVGYEQIALLRDIELAAGHRSSWNLVPRRYDVDDATVVDLQRAGFEVGVHGLYHDGRDLESLATLRERLPEIRAYAERWRAVGFRSPATHRRWDLMPLLGFGYDSSYPDTDPWEPVSGGCLSLLPFFNEDLVELPITLPQDHTVFVILRKLDEALWLEKAQLVREHGGMALLITHPDYMLEPLLLEAYGRFLGAFADDDGVWRALPCEVADWWRRRGASRLERSKGAWRVVGLAADEAEIRYVEGARARAST